MTGKATKILTISVFIGAVFAIIGLIVYPRISTDKQNQENRQSRVIIPQAMASDEVYSSGSTAERMAYEDDISSKVALREGESLVSVLSQNFDADPQEEQVIAYRRLTEIESPVYISYIDYDEVQGGYRRIWETPTAVTKPGTFSMFTQDMVGDRSICLIVMGMNSAGEHTLTVLQKSRAAAAEAGEEEPAFIKIAELHADGSLAINETGRSTAYQLGLSSGESFTILSYSRDYESSNILDQIETTYRYNPVNGLYEQQRVARIPGTQIEQRQVRELLSGSADKFEHFIDGLWYYVSPEGTLDQRQYIYFDPDNREIIFFADETQQVFSWHNSSPTRYGLYISSQNISVTTLRRFLEIELATLESIRVKVSEDVRLKIGVSAPWNGTYRKAGIAELRSPAEQTPVPPYISSEYDGSIGKMVFSSDGTYELHTGALVQRGRYTFFMMGSIELLELRPENIAGLTRDVYRVERPGTGQEDDRGTAGDLTLTRVRLGTRGIQDLHEAAISLARVNTGQENREDTGSGS
ncbi:pallilysin-related adhesin [Breznakiella homolactica]|uniref:Pallilysin-related adhesin n=1 Tax=Breznakiella homolactica TaxID=2798577 RepID=A0A7T7XJJ8_9SPIR|nr:pallilysin-related adhesin [Breznakiella homolactica]QQO07546.1 pallilysin-related adhesin [Breznakiella homolactica]